MPTPAERRALFFLSALLALGGAVRSYAALAGTEPPPSPQERSALDAQIQAVDSARLQDSVRKRSARSKRGRKPAQLPTGEPPSLPAVPAGSGISQTAPDTPPTELFLKVPRKPRRNKSDSSSNSNTNRAPVDLDVAPAAEIERLPRIGPVLARRIAADRDSLGPFGSLQELTRVRGVGPALARILKPYVTFSLEPRPHRVADPGGRGTTRKPRRGRPRVSDPP